jgi:hypothetical protein
MQSHTTLAHSAFGQFEISLSLHMQIYMQMHTHDSRNCQSGGTRGRGPPGAQPRTARLRSHSTRRVGRCTHRDTAAPMPYKEDRPRTSYMPHDSTHPAPTRVIPRHCSAAALQLRPQGPYTRRHDDATSSTRLMFRQTWLRPQGPYTRRHEDATTSDPVEVSSDLVEVSSDSVEVR